MCPLRGQVPADCRLVTAVDVTADESLLTGEPDDIAGAALFLASGAGSFVTGQTIVVDGGVTIASSIG